jgi:hypothetical protein
MEWTGLSQYRSRSRMRLPYGPAHRAPAQPGRVQCDDDNPIAAMTVPGRRPFGMFADLAALAMATDA